MAYVRDGTTFGELFLQEPDLFPGRASGEPWGGESLRLDIAGGPYRALGLSALQRDALASRFGPCLLAAEPEADDVVLRLYRAPAGDFREIAQEPWETGFDFEHLPSSVLMAGHRCMARLDGLPHPEGSLWIPEPRGEQELSGLLENFLRVVAAYRVLEQGGALLHSAGIEVEGGAWLFVGRSGAGKSTLSRLSAERGFEVLSDELNALRERDGELWLERMPFAGDYGRFSAERRSSPLRRLHFLRQGASPRVDSISRGAAIAELAAAAPFLNVDPLRGDRLLANLERLTARTEMGVLTFARDPGFWDILLARS